MIFGLLFLFGHYGDVPFSTLDDPLLIAILARHLRRHPGARQPPPGLDLVPAVDALLRRQLGDEPVAVPQGRRRRGEARPRDREGGADRRRAARPSSTTARRAELHARQGPRVPRDALPRPRAQRAARRAPSTTSRPTTCARASWSPASSSAGTSATATSTTSSCSTPCRSGAASSRATCGWSTLESQPAHDPAPALPDLRRRRPGWSRRAGSTSPTWSARQPWLDERDFPVEVDAAASGAGRAEPGVSERDRRRLRAQRARLRRRARARGRGGHGARGRATTIGGGTRSAELTLPGLLHDDCSAVHPMAVGVAVPDARSTSSATGSSGAGPRSTSPTRSTTAAPACMVRSIERDGRRARRGRARPGGALFGAASRALRRRSPRTSCGRSCTCRATRCALARFGLPRGAAGDRARARAAGRRRRARCSAASPRTPSARSTGR